MGDFVECKYCGSELYFEEQTPNSTHRWKAVCTNCKNKKGADKFNDWVSDAQVTEILKQYPYTTLISYYGSEIFKQNYGKLAESYWIKTYMTRDSISDFNAEQIVRFERWMKAEADGKLTRLKYDTEEIKTNIKRLFNNKKKS